MTSLKYKAETFLVGGFATLVLAITSFDFNPWVLILAFMALSYSSFLSYLATQLFSSQDEEELEIRKFNVAEILYFGQLVLVGIFLVLANYVIHLETGSGLVSLFAERLNLLEMWLLFCSVLIFIGVTVKDYKKVIQRYKEELDG